MARNPIKGKGPHTQKAVTCGECGNVTYVLSLAAGAVACTACGALSRASAAAPTKAAVTNRG